MSNSRRRFNVVGFATGAAAAVDAVSLYSQKGEFTNQTQDFMFPSDLVEPTQRRNAYIHMRFESYVRRSIYQQPFYTPVSGIRLPIPARLQDSVSVQYDTGTELGTAVGAAIDAVSNFSQGIARDVLAGNFGAAAGAAVQSGFSVFAGVGAATAIDRAAEGISNRIPGTTGGQVRAGVESLTGITTNPFQVVLFRHPQFKKHSFSWKLVPKSQAETETLEDIISTFKYHMLPSISAGGIFFGYPEILQVKLYPRDQYLYKFKPCVVESVNVNYAPNGPSFYRSTGAPTAVEFSISLQEIEMWTKADYFRDENGRVATITATREAQERSNREREAIAIATGGG